MGNVIQGELLGQGKKFAIVISRFNEFITSRLLSGAQDCFERHGVAVTRRHLRGYLAGLPDLEALRARMLRADTLEEALRVLETAGG